MKFKKNQNINLIKAKHQISTNKTQTDEIIQLIKVTNYDKSSKYKNK